LVSAEPAPAFCVGGSNPAIVLPRGMLSSMTPAQLRMIVLHEVAHLQRRDPALFLALHCVDVLFWFNPFVRALTARTRLAAEIACDAIALEAGAGKSEYARAFVCAIDQQGAPAPVAVAAFGDRGEGPRIRLAHILAGATRRRGVALSSAIVAAACVFCAAGAAVAASTGRMALFGDSMLLAALEARAAHVYGAPQCGPSDLSPLPPIAGDRP
jgi:beta-lactamase regulating signal transducer with metallopeptidase domain